MVSRGQFGLVITFLSQFPSFAVLTEETLKEIVKTLVQSFNRGYIKMELNDK